jgi:WD40 repeat protein
MRGVKEPATVAWTTAVPEYPTAVAIAGDTVALGLADGSIARYEAAVGLLRDRRAAHDGAVLALAANPRDPILASGGEDGAVKAHRGSESVGLDPGGGGWVEQLAWSPGGKRLAGAQSRTVRVWSVDGRLVVRSPELESTITGIGWSKDGRRVAAACYGGVRVVDTTTGLIANRLDWKGAMLGLAWSPDGRAIACGSQDGTVHFWRMPSGDDSMMSGYPCKPSAIAWSADSRWLATGGAAAITVWPFDGRGPEGRDPLSLEAHDEPISALAFAPRGPLLASGCRGGRLALWRLPEPVPLAVLPIGARIEFLSWAPGRLVAVNGDAVVSIDLAGGAA